MVQRVAVHVGKIGPARVCLVLKAFALFRGGNEVLHAQKAAQGVVCDLRLAAHVPLDPQPRVKAEDAGSRRAAEVLQAALIQPHPDVVVDLVGVDAVVALRQVVFQLQGVGILFHKVAVGVPLAELANADVHHAEHAGKHQHRRRHALGKAAVLPPYAAEVAVQHKPQQTKAQHDKELFRVLQHAEGPCPGGIVPHGHHRKHQRSQHDPANAPGGGVQINIRVLQRVHGHGGKDKGGHIVPACVVAGVERVEGTVQHRHQRAHGAYCHDALFAVGLAAAPVGHGTGQTAQGQVGRHARPLDHALRPDRGKVRRVRRQDPAEQDSQILLHLGVGQKAPAGGKVNGARVLQQAKHCREQQQTTHGNAQHALPQKLPELAPGQPEVLGSQLAHKVDTQENDLSHKEEVVVQQVHRHPEGEQAVTVFINGLVQRPEQIGEQRHHIHKVVEEHVVHRKAGKRVQAGTQHRVVLVFDVAAQIQERAAARHAELEHQQRHHHIGQPALRQQHRQPEERRAVQVEGVGVHHPAAKVGRPRKGIVRRTCKGAVRVARTLYKAVHIPVKGDLLAVKIACIVEKAAVKDVERQKEDGRRQGAQPHRLPEFFMALPPWGEQPWFFELFHSVPLSPRTGAEVDLMSPCSIARRRARKKGLTSARGAGMVKKRRRIAMLYPFSALLARMKYITRWSLMHSTRAESLSEHTCDTALLAHLLCLIAKHYTGTPCRPEVVAVAALYHDAPEIITGDMPTPVKYHSPALRDAYKALETESVRSMAALLPAELAAELTPCMDGSVLTAEEHRLLKAADRLSALIKCTEEQRSGNHEFDAALTQQRAALLAMHCPEADWFLAHCLPCYTQNLDELTRP